MSILLSIIKPIGSVLLSMLMATLTGPVIKRLIFRFLEAEAKRYSERALETTSKEDDARAKMFLGIIEDLRKAWEIGA